MAGTATPRILLVGTSYGTFEGSISSINLEVARMFAAAGAEVYATVLEASEQDERDAKRDGVTLLKPRLGADSSAKPSLEWLTWFHKHHFPHIPSGICCIVGHVDVTSRAAREIKEERFPHAKLAMFGHVMPQETEHYTSDEKALGVGRKEANIQDDLGKADVVFSVGALIHRFNDSFLRRRHVDHHIFLPEPSKLFSDANVSFHEEAGVRKPERVILSIGRVRNVERLKGHDLAAGGVDKAALRLDHLYTLRLRVRAIDENDFMESKRILDEKLRSGRVQPTLLPYGTQEEIRRDMENCHLVLMPSRAEPFGLVGLEAIAAGVPVLISEHSGLAELIEELSDRLGQPKFRHCIVKMKGNDATTDAEKWAERIEDVIKNARSEFEEARAFKEKLLASKYWEESHQKFLQACGIMATTAGYRTNQEREFQLTLERMSSRLDKTDVRKLLWVWSARTGQQESAGIERPEDLMRAMEKSGHIATDDLGMLEKDMMAAGISLPVIVGDIPGVSDKFQYPRTTEASVGSVGRKVEIPGFVKLVVPPRALQRETTITVSTVDIPGILRDDEGASWTSGYPWSLGENTCPRELLDQVLFSPAVNVSLHGARLSGPVELETWRPPGSEGMECILLKNVRGEGWRDITALTEHQIYAEKISMSMRTFCPVTVWWTPVNTVRAVKDTVLAALTSRTLDCWFAAYIRPLAEKVEFHVVCRDMSVDTDDYRSGFTLCGSNEAIFGLCNGDRIVVTVVVDGCQKKSKHTTLRAKLCRKEFGQKIQMILEGPTRHPANGEVAVTKKTHGSQLQTVCELTFSEECSPSDLGSGARRAVPSKSDVQERFEAVITDVSRKWDDLARKLGFSENEIAVIHTSKIDQDRRCREMLHRWKSREGMEATLQVLKQALIDIGERQTAEHLGDERPSRGSSPSDE